MLDHVKEYLRIDGDQDDKMLGFLVDSAKEYLTDSGVRATEGSQYKLAIVMLVKQWYEDNRNESTSSRKAMHIDHGLQSIILKLKVGG